MRVYPFIKEHSFIFISSVLFLLSASIFFLSIKSQIEFIEFPYQHEYREGAVMTTVKLYLENENPFELKYQPQNTYAYGFVYPLLVSPFAKAFGNTLEVHRWISYIFILLSCALVFLTLISEKVNPAFSFAAAVILHQSLVNNGMISIARPEALGIFLYLLGILIPWRFKFSYWSCVVSIILGILAYLTKPYYILIILFIGAYLFIFVSKRKAIVYGIVSTLFIVIMIIVVDLIYETYHNNTFFFHNIISVYEYPHMKRQLFQYIDLNFILLFTITLSLLLIFKNLWHLKLKGKSGKTLSLLGSNFLFNRNIYILKDEPLVKTKIDLLFGFVSVFATFLFIIKLGGHTGNSGGAYLFHLVSPFLILTMFQLVEATRDKVFKSVFAIIIIFTLSRQFKPAKYDFEKLSGCFKKIEDVIKLSNRPLNSPETVSIMIHQNKPVYNSGHTEYFQMGVSNLSIWSGASAGVMERKKEFEKEITNKIVDKYFDLILVTKGIQSVLIDSVALIQNYECEDTLCASMVYKSWNIEAWYPKNK